MFMLFNKNNSSFFFLVIYLYIWFPTLWCLVVVGFVMIIIATAIIIDVNIGVTSIAAAAASQECTKDSVLC